MKLQRLTDNPEASFQPFSIKLTVENITELAILRQLSDMGQKDGYFDLTLKSPHETEVMEDFLMKLTRALEDL